MNLTSRPGWNLALLPLALLVVATVLILGNTAAGMVQIWYRSDTFAHAFLVPPISLWLAWRMRDRLALLAPKPALWVLLPMAIAGFAWLLGELVGVNALAQFALVALLVLSVPALLGLQVSRALMFPLGFLFFAVPMGEFLLPILMQWTADFTVAAVRLSGVPVYREGLKFVIPSGSWSVVEACSGVRYLIASFMVGTLFAYLNYRSTQRRWIFVGVSILVPVLANWLRAYMIVMIGHLSDNKLATGVDHLVYGWVFFGVVIMLLFWIGARWSEPDEPAPDASAALIASTRPAAPAKAFWIALAATLIVVASPVAVLHTLTPAAHASSPATLSLPEGAASGWQTAPAMPLDWSPVFQNPSAKVSRAYAGPAGQLVGVHVLYYRQQNDASKLVSSVNTVINADDDHWNSVATTTRQLAIAGASGPVAVREIQVLGPDVSGRAQRDRMRVWQVYWINGVWVAGDAQAKLQAAKDRLLGRSDDGAAVLIFARDDQDGSAEKVLSAWATAQLVGLEKSLIAARDGLPARP